MDKWYYYLKKGRAVGPIMHEDFLILVEDQEVGPFDLVYEEGHKKWIPLLQHKELASHLKQAAQPQQDSASHWILLRKTSGKQGQGKKQYLQEGPYTTERVWSGIKAGHFQFSDFAWKKGDKSWTRIGELDEFSGTMPDSLPDFFTPKDALISKSDEAEGGEPPEIVDFVQQKIEPVVLAEPPPPEAKGEDLVSHSKNEELSNLNTNSEKNEKKEASLLKRANKKKAGTKGLVKEKKVQKRQGQNEKDSENRPKNKSSKKKKSTPLKASTQENDSRKGVSGRSSIMPDVDTQTTSIRVAKKNNQKEKETSEEGLSAKKVVVDWEPKKKESKDFVEENSSKNLKGDSEGPLLGSVSHWWLRGLIIIFFVTGLSVYFILASRPNEAYLEQAAKYQKTNEGQIEQKRGEHNKTKRPSNYQGARAQQRDERSAKPEQSVSSSKPVPTNSRSSQVNAVAPQQIVAKKKAAPPEVKKEPTWLKLNFQGWSGAAPKISVTSNGSSHYPVLIYLFGMPGQLEGRDKYLLIKEVKKTAKGAYNWDLKQYNMPRGLYLVWAQVEGVKKTAMAFYGVKNSQYRNSLATQRKKSASYYFYERKKLFRMARDLSLSATRLSKELKKVGGHGGRAQGVISSWLARHRSQAASTIRRLNYRSADSYLMPHFWFQLQDINREVEEQALAWQSDPSKIPRTLAVEKQFDVFGQNVARWTAWTD